MAEAAEPVGLVSLSGGDGSSAGALQCGSLGLRPLLAWEIWVQNSHF